MSKRKVAKNLINTSMNYNLQKPEIISPYNTTKMETVAQKDINLKKIYLPSIQKKIIPRYPIPSTKLIKSRSLIYLPLNDNNNPKTTNPNDEKEKLILAKLTLSRIETKVNDMIFDCKKLAGEKEENLKLIKEVVNSNNSTNKESLITKIQYVFEDILKNNNFNKKTFSTENFDNIKYTIEEKNSKNEDIKYKSGKNREGSGKIRINVSPINALNEKNNLSKIIQGEQNNDIIDENKENKDADKIKEDNNKNEKNNAINSKGMIEEIKNNENIIIDSNNKKIDDFNQEISNLQDFSAENMLKINAVSANNSNFNNISFNNNMLNMNNSLDEQMKEIIEEEKDDKDMSLIFGKSAVPKKVYNKVKIKSELSILKHKIITIQQQIRLKDEEIEEIKSKATMKNLIFQSNMLDTKMVKLHKIKTKNNHFERLSIPKKNIKKGNLINELDYYTKKNKSFISENKTVEESYLKVRNEFEENNKTYTKLEKKNDHLKYKYNSLRLKDVKKQIDLDNLRNKITQIDSMKLMIENNIRIRDVKKKEIEETKKLLEKKSEDFEKIKENKDKNYKEMNRLQKEINNKINKLKNDSNKIQKDIKDIEKNIQREIDKFQHLTKNNIKYINLNYIYKIKSIPEFLDILKEIEKEGEKPLDENKKTKFENLQKGESYTFNKISITKKKEPKKEEKKTEENPPELENKLEYYINSNGELLLRNEEKEGNNDVKK